MHYIGDFLTNYGKALSMAGKHQKAIEVFQQATTYYPNTIVYTALSDSYKETGQIKKAETAYLQSWHMNPSLFYPKYLLAKLYDESGQNEKAVFTANELLQKQAKIESTAIEEIKTEMLEIIEKAGLETSKDDNKLLNNFYTKKLKNKGAYRSKVRTVSFKLQMW